MFTTGIDFLILYACVQMFLLNPTEGKIYAFFGALIFSFIVNKTWTFKEKNQEDWNAQQFIKFLLVSSIAFALSYVLMKVMTEIWDIHYLIANAIISIVVLSWNFTANSFWTFKTTDIHEAQMPLMPEKKNFKYELSIVIPAYNEEKRLPKTIISALKYFSSLEIDYEIIIVNDGSTDNTQRSVQKLIDQIEAQKGILKCINLEKNKGKGFAVKTGVLASQGRFILFADADEATPFSEYCKLRNSMIMSHIAIGSRYKKKGTVIEAQPYWRIIISRVVNFFSQIFLIEGIKDTQCGFKLFRSHVGKEIFGLQRIERFAFDVEFLMLAKSHDYRISEIPVTWYDQEGSTVSFWRDSIRTIKDFFIIKFMMIFRLY